MPDHSSDSTARSSNGAATPCSSKSALAPCVYIGLQCPSCGDVRQALAQLPSSPAVRCPQCGTSCSFIPLGSGATRRSLPFFEIPRANTKLMFRPDEIPSDGAPLFGFQEHADPRSKVIASPSSQRAGLSGRRSMKPSLSG